MAAVKNNNMKKIILFSLFLFIFIFSIEKVKALDIFNEKQQIFNEVKDLIKNDYVEKNVDSGKLMYGAIKGMIESLEDPYTRFMEPKPFKEMKMRMKGSYSGIGIYIGIKNKQITVISPIKETPAAKAGLKAFDHIVTIEDKPTKDMPIDEAVSMIRGQRGTMVKIGIMRGSEKKPREFLISRANIVIKSVEKKILENSVGYIKLNTFENLKANSEMERAIRSLKLKNIKGLIVDVRNNGGGLLSNAIEIASLFLPKDEVIVLVVDREGKKEPIKSLGTQIWSGPLIVLMNEASASASEILAGALRDNKTATLVGQHSFGKASVQSIRQLQDGSAILLTIAKYQTPNGEDIAKKGIKPDILVKIEKSKDKASEEAEDIIPIDEENDVQLKKAVEILKGKIVDKKND